jgi:hypothetical protein
MASRTRDLPADVQVLNHERAHLRERHQSVWRAAEDRMGG